MKSALFVRTAFAYVLMFAFGCVVFYLTAWQGLVYIWPKLSVMWLPVVMVTMSSLCLVTSNCLDGKDSGILEILNIIIEAMADIFDRRNVNQNISALPFFWIYLFFVLSVVAVLVFAAARLLVELVAGKEM